MNDEMISVRKDNLAEILNDRSIDAIIAIDTECKVIYWNATASLTYSVSKKQAIGKSLFELIPKLEEDNETVNAIKRALQGHKTFVPASKQYAHRHHAENHYIPLKESDGSLIGVMNLVHDVAHRIKAEEQLQYLNEELLRKNETLLRYNQELVALGNAASDHLKDPLRKIYTAVEAIITGEAKSFSNNGKAHLRRIQSAVQRMGLITDDLLSFLNITKEKKDDEYSDVDLNAVLQKAKEKLHKIIEEKEAVVHAEPLPLLFGNYNLLVQLFQNIINNAIKFHQQDTVPKVHISATNLKKGNKNYVRIMFKDNGIGFKKQHAIEIFNPFTRLSNAEQFRGSGIGLAVCKKIIEQHNGLIEANSEEGSGTEICCYFPV